MFVDASVVVAILTKEDDAATLASRIGRASRVYVSPIVMFEATAAIVHKIDAVLQGRRGVGSCE